MRRIDGVGLGFGPELDLTRHDIMQISANTKADRLWQTE